MDNKSTWEHISQYLAQLGEANHEHHKVRLFSLSLTGTAFSWFSALAPNSIHTWFHLEQKFNEHFYAGEVELKLSHLTSVKQKPDESVSDYIKRFSNTRNQCYNLVITERDMADLVLNGLRSHLKEKLEGYEFMSVGQVQDRTLVQESRANEVKDSHRVSRSQLNVIDANDSPQRPNLILVMLLGRSIRIVTKR